MQETGTRYGKAGLVVSGGGIRFKAKGSGYFFQRKDFDRSRSGKTGAVFFTEKTCFIHDIFSSKVVDIACL